jgi:FixJ family two-component response regulator
MPAARIVAIVDDDESIRVGLASLVRSLGWSVRVYACAEALLYSGEAQSSTCVISDVQMPGITGLEMQDRLVAQGCALPIIFITAFSTEVSRCRAMENGALCFLNKPVDVQEITRFLEIAMSCA